MATENISIGSENLRARGHTLNIVLSHLSSEKDLLLYDSGRENTIFPLLRFAAYLAVRS